ncbi:MAG TPA: MoxR family ATPase [Ruminiclostridium sp.]|uniref:ATPase RavA n=1 Tax=Acetivibrio saccincola TaxID=1677857 RepID=A0A2K9E1Z7_9FIRM|nr:MoxR family ATPase [Acetivibrio saccincola]AUG57762.1 ATPase RavA [Acetivibrio saccincola]NLW28092.1 MoxR family ATPase [Acetivibrio saccincola]HAA42647.1 MoxR family ATPase [Ruminiclostridium sp.]HQD29157.1 MoxR family ATPase [Acetivibrio saccincola]
MDINESKIKKVIDTVSRIESEVAKHMIGQKPLIRQVLISILAGGNVLLEGVPGLGKTRLVKTFGNVMDLKFSRIQFTPDLMPADVTGTNIITQNEKGKGEFTFQKGPVFTNILLADEINRATPKTQSALLEAMQEKTVTVGNSTYELPKPFFVLATQNPLEMEGTYPLPEAQLDRFLFKLTVPFPSLEELVDIVSMTTGKEDEDLDTVTNGEEILEIRSITRQVPVAKPVLEFASKLILATHPESEYAPEVTKKYIRFGSSPRGAQAIISTAKIRAFLEGRYNVAFDDIKYVAYPALRHRFFLNFDGMSEGITTDDLIGEIIKEIERQ